MNDRQQAFVRHYVACLNATEAAARAGYGGTRATLAVTGYDLLRNPKIKVAIDEALKESAMSPSEILARISDQARASLDGFFTIRGRGVTLDLKAAQAAGLMHLAKKYTKTKETVTIELYDAQKALELLAKHYALLTDRQEMSGGLTITQFTEALDTTYADSDSTDE